MSTYDRAPNRINGDQARALAALFDGRLEGTTYDDIEPPTAVALASIDNGDHDDARACTLGVVASDGRMWQIVTAGITWPVER